MTGPARGWRGYARWWLPRAALLLVPAAVAAVARADAAVPLTAAALSFAAFSLVVRVVTDRRPVAAGDRGCGWRAYDGGRPGRWRGGWLHRDAGGTVLVVANLGANGPRLAAATTRGVTERPARGRERLHVAVRARILRVERADGEPVEVAAPPETLDLLRSWLAS
ncbi:MAG TPA: hypothetical protein VFQ85_11810 [Mycobacteriales bacterium]|nr:hypothetical protein [Mycobacteriales bacterium]